METTSSYRNRWWINQEWQQWSVWRMFAAKVPLDAFYIWKNLFFKLEKDIQWHLVKMYNLITLHSWSSIFHQKHSANITHVRNTLQTTSRTVWKTVWFSAHTVLQLLLSFQPMSIHRCEIIQKCKNRGASFRREKRKDKDSHEEFENRAKKWTWQCRETETPPSYSKEKEQRIPFGIQHSNPPLFIHHPHCLTNLRSIAW